MTKKERAAPAFQFYPADWMAGAPGRMAPDETHVYVWLLCLDWTQGGFVFEPVELARWCKMSTAKFKRAWAKVGDNFTSRDGRLYNPRLEKERQKQTEWRTKSSVGGRRGADRRWPQRQQGGNGGAIQGGTQGGNTTGNTKTTHCSLQTAVGVISTPPTASDPPRALDSALDRNHAELEDLNRRRLARGDPPLTYAEAFGGR